MQVLECTEASRSAYTLAKIFPLIRALGQLCLLGHKTQRQRFSLEHLHASSNACFSTASASETVIVSSWNILKLFWSIRVSASIHSTERPTISKLTCFLTCLAKLLANSPK